MTILLVFARIHDNMKSRTSNKKIGPQHYRPRSIFNRGHGVLFNPVWVWCQKSTFLVSSEHDKDLQHLPNEYAGVCFWRSEEDFPSNSPNQHMVILGLFYHFFRLSGPETQPICAILHLWSLKSLWPLELSSLLCIKTK